MTCNRIVKATFSTGDTRARNTVIRTFTHAYLVRLRRPDGQTYERSGFSVSEDQCRRNMLAETAYVRRQGYVPIVEEVVPVEVIEQRSAA
jgi:hypothetical protein